MLSLCAQTQPAIVKVRNLFKHLKASQTRYNTFLTIAGLSPVLPCDTRWNLWLLLIQRALQTATTIAHFTSEYQDCVDYRLNDDDLDILKDTEFLLPFFEATKDTEGDNVTLEQLQETLDILKSHYTESFAKYIGQAYS